MDNMVGCWGNPQVSEFTLNSDGTGIFRKAGQRPQAIAWGTQGESWIMVSHVPSLNDNIIFRHRIIELTENYFVIHGITISTLSTEPKLLEGEMGNVPITVERCFEQDEYIGS